MTRVDISLLPLRMGKWNKIKKVKNCCKISNSFNKFQVLNSKRETIFWFVSDFLSSQKHCTKMLFFMKQFSMRTHFNIIVNTDDNKNFGKRKLENTPVSLSTKIQRDCSIWSLLKLCVTWLTALSTNYWLSILNKNWILQLCWIVYQYAWSKSL